MKACQIATLICLLAARSGAQTTLPDGVVRYEKAGPLPSFWQYVKDHWGWVVSSRPFGKSVAFLVGVGKYEHIGPDLRYVSSDLKDMREFLINYAGFDTVFVAQDTATVKLVENYMFNEFPRTLQTDDRLLFYLSGHGVDLSGQGYVQFAKAKPNEYDPDQYLDVTRCEQWSRRIRAKHVLFLIDACNSGLGYESKLGSEVHVDEDLLSLFSGDGSRVVITAGTGNEKSFQVDEGNNRGYSVFTRAFLDAIRNTKSPNGFLILDEVMAGLRLNVASFTRSSPGRKMTPRLWQIPRSPGTDEGTFVFLNPQVRTPAIPPVIKQFITLTPKMGTESTKISLEEAKKAILGTWEAQNFQGVLGSGFMTFEPDGTISSTFPNIFTYHLVDSEHLIVTTLFGHGFDEPFEAHLAGPDQYLKCLSFACQNHIWRRAR